MTDSTTKNKISTWFNTKLFHVNGKPLKFHLEGYNAMECCRLVRIIEAYGGKLSEPTGDTIIFSEPDRSIGVRQCYHLKYLRNSIMLNQLLKLEKYKLPLTAHRHREVRNCDCGTPENKNSGENHDTPNNLFGKVKQECTNEVNDAASTFSRESCSSDDSCTAARTKLFVFTNERKRKCVERVKEETDNKKFRKRDTGDNGSIVHDKNSVSLENISDKNHREKSNDSSFDETILHKKKSTICYTEEESRQMIQYLIDKNVIRFGKSRKIWEKMKADLKITRRSANGMRIHFCESLRHKYKQYTEDINAHKEFQQLFSPKNHKLYTDEEHHKIIQYLIDSNSISRARGKQIWREMREKNITKRSFGSLQTHFCKVLKYKYKLYTDDVDAHREFEKLLEPADPTPECGSKNSYQLRVQSKANDRARERIHS